MQQVHDRAIPCRCTSAHFHSSSNQRRRAFRNVSSYRRKSKCHEREAKPTGRVVEASRRDEDQGAEYQYAEDEESDRSENETSKRFWNWTIRAIRGSFLRLLDPPGVLQKLLHD